MFKRIALGTLLVLCALAFVTPASAVNVNGVEYVLLAKSQILMENSKDCEPVPPDTLGCFIINGNVAVNDLDGIMKIGANNIINGTATANHIVFGTNSHITTCVFNTSSGVPAASVCDNIVSPIPAGVLPIAAWPPGPLGAVPVDNCVNAAANVTVAAGATQALAPGCYRDVRINAGGTLNLTPAGAYVFRTLRLIAGSTLNGEGSTATSVNVQSLTITESGVKINGVTIKSPGTVGFSVTEFIKIFNNSVLTDVILYAPTSGIHLHTGMSATGLEAVANFITVEPIIVEGVIESAVCPCVETVDLLGTNLFLGGGHKLDDPNNRFFLSADCDPAGKPEVFRTASSDTTATLDVTGQVTTGKRVIITNTAGSFCSSVILP